MKRILLFTMCFTFTFATLNAQDYNQVIFTGDAGTDAWEDPENWRRGGDPSLPGVPEEGDDILIEGFSVYFNGLGSIPQQDYGNLELRFGARLFTQGDFYLYGDFIVDASSTFEVVVQDIDLFNKVTCEGNFYFNGTVNLLFSGYAPQIGDAFQVVEGNQGSCPSPTSYLNPSFDFDTILTAQCDFDGLYYEVLDINYTTSIAWDGEGNDGMWSNPANWDPNGIPAADSRVVINLPGGDFVSTNGAGITAVANVILGADSTLEINGDFLLDKYIYVKKGATLSWTDGKIYSNDPNDQSGINSYGNVNLDGPGTKELDTNMYLWTFFDDINHNQGNLNINNGTVRVFNFNSYNINGDNITIGYNSGTLHELTVSVISALKKTTGSGTSSVNLTTFINYGDVISESGTLAFNEDLTTGEYLDWIGSYGGSGSIQFPNNFVLDGVVAPGSSPGVLTVVGDFVTSTSATFEIEIDGPNAGTQYDQITVTNNAALEGEIEVTLGYLPANDASFEIIKSNETYNCSLPSTVTATYNGTPYTFDVVCHNNSVYLNGPNAVLSTTENILEDISIYPNPVSSVLNIKSNLISKGNWQLINQLGQVVKSSTFESNEVKINVKEMPTGIYLFKIEDDNLNATTTKRIVVSN